MKPRPTTLTRKDSRMQKRLLLSLIVPLIFACAHTPTAAETAPTPNAPPPFSLARADAERAMLIAKPYNLMGVQRCAETILVVTGSRPQIIQPIGPLSGAAAKQAERKAIDPDSPEAHAIYNACLKALVSVQEILDRLGL